MVEGTKGGGVREEEKIARTLSRGSGKRKSQKALTCWQMDAQKHLRDYESGVKKRTSLMTRGCTSLLRVRGPKKEIPNLLGGKAR